MSDKLYIGANLIKITIDDPKDKDGVVVTFDKGGSCYLKKKLYDFIVRKVKGNGESVWEVANAYIALSFCKELADYGYERFQLEGIATAIGNTVHNRAEAVIGKKFGVTGSLNIKLSDLL